MSHMTEEEGSKDLCRGHGYREKPGDIAFPALPDEHVEKEQGREGLLLSGSSVL